MNPSGQGGLGSLFPWIFGFRFFIKNQTAQGSMLKNKIANSTRKHVALPQKKCQCS
jgi:hypothetical protein